MRLPCLVAAWLPLSLATARHSFSLFQRRSTRLRLVYAQSGQATGASLRLAGMAGRAPRRRTWSRKAWPA